MTAEELARDLVTIREEMESKTAAIREYITGLKTEIAAREEEVRNIETLYCENAVKKMKDWINSK